MNQTNETVTLSLTVSDAAGTTVFNGWYNLAPQGRDNTGPVATARGVYRVAISVDDHRAGTGDLRVEECYFGAVATVGNNTVSISQAVS